MISHFWFDEISFIVSKIGFRFLIKQPIFLFSLLKTILLLHIVLRSLLFDFISRNLFLFHFIFQNLRLDVKNEVKSFTLFHKRILNQQRSFREAYLIILRFTFQLIHFLDSSEILNLSMVLSKKRVSIFAIVDQSFAGQDNLCKNCLRKNIDIYQEYKTQKDKLYIA